MSRCAHWVFIYVLGLSWVLQRSDMFLFMLLKSLRGERKSTAEWAESSSSPVCCSGGMASEGGGSGHRDPRDRGDPAVWDRPTGGQPDHFSLQGKQQEIGCLSPNLSSCAEKMIRWCLRRALDELWLDDVTGVGLDWPCRSHINVELRDKLGSWRLHSKRGCWLHSELLMKTKSYQVGRQKYL